MLQHPQHWQLPTNIAALMPVNLKLLVDAKAQRVLVVDTKQRVLFVKAKDAVEILFFLDSMVGSACDIIANAAKLAATVWLTLLDTKFGDGGE
jgi:hypothetical protein